MITAYTLLRITLGLNILLHGLVRTPKTRYQAFVAAVQTEFKDTLLPDKLVSVVAQSIPLLESIIGLLILTGFCTGLSILAGFALMILLLTAKSIKQDWYTVSLQMIYILYYTLLQAGLRYNTFSLDSLFFHSRQTCLY